MTAKRVVILAAAAIVLILAVTGTYYFVLPPGASATVTIVATGDEANVAFAPANFTVQEGQKVTLVFVNHGSAPHELEIPTLSVNTGIVNGGATTRVSFTPNKVGTFTFEQACGTFPEPYCNVAGHVTVLSP